jgi:hypothetical protein
LSEDASQPEQEFVIGWLLSGAKFDVGLNRVRIPMMSISRSEVMAISAERSDERLFQCESVIGIRQGF